MALIYYVYQQTQEETLIEVIIFKLQLNKN